MGIIKNILFGMLCYFILFNILYGIGRLIHVFPPYTVIYHFYILHKIKQIDGINNLSYAIELDKISDIYYQNEFEKWGLDKRKEAIKSIFDAIDQSDITVSTTGLISREIYSEFDSSRNIYVN